MNTKASSNNAFDFIKFDFENHQKLIYFINNYSSIVTFLIYIKKTTSTNSVTIYFQKDILLLLLSSSFLLNSSLFLFFYHTFLYFYLILYLFANWYLWIFPNFHDDFKFFCSLFKIITVSLIWSFIVAFVF